jgi:hypothetical protein
LGLVTTNDSVAVTSSVDVAAKGLDTAAFTADVPGEYGVTVFLFSRVPGANSFGEDGSARWRLRVTDSDTVNIGGYADLPIVTNRGDGATLRVTIVGSTVSAAELRDFTTEPARVAALQTAVTDALAAIASTTVATAIGDFQARVTDLQTEFADHIGSATWHLVADEKNVPLIAQPTSQDAAIAVLNEISTLAPLHFLDDDTGDSPYHTNGDPASISVARDAANLAEATVLLADLRERGFERHRVKGTGNTPPVHTTAGADTTNALSAPTKLDDIIVAYLDALVDADPSVAAGEPEGLIDAAHMAGFRIVT